MWELDYKESWALKNWCFWTVVLEKTLESPLNCKEIQPVHPKGYQSWMFIGRTDAEAETPMLWPRNVKSWLTGKDPDAGKDWRQEKKETTEDEIVGWHHQLDGHGFGWTLGVGDGQGGLACCGSWGRKESDTTEQLNWIELNSMKTGREGSLVRKNILETEEHHWRRKHKWKSLRQEIIRYVLRNCWKVSVIRVCLVVQWQIILLPTQKTLVHSLGWENILEKEMATHYSILFWKIPWTKESGRVQSMGLQKTQIQWRD